MWYIGRNFMPWREQMALHLALVAWRRTVRQRHKLEMAAVQALAIAHETYFVRWYKVAGFEDLAARR